MATMKAGTICHIRGSYDDWRVIVTSFDGLVFCPRTATRCFCRWFRSFQLELARPSYINRKIETFERFFSDAKSTSKN